VKRSHETARSCYGLLIAIFAAVRINAQIPTLKADTGSDLLQQCEAVPETQVDSAGLLRGGYCVGYLMGTASSLRLYQSEQNERAPACIPQAATGRELAMAVIKFLKDNPKRLEDPYANVVLLALAAAYPCARL
jgi:hypothetical protein